MALVLSSGALKLLARLGLTLLFTTIIVRWVYTAELIADLRERTHLPVERVEIGNVDLLRDSVDVVIYCRSAIPPRT